VSGSGDMNLRGISKEFEAAISGSGDIEAYNVEADNVGPPYPVSAILMWRSRKC